MYTIPSIMESKHYIVKKITIRAAGPGMNRIPGGFFRRMRRLPALVLSLAVLAPQACSSAPDLSPENWADDYDRFMAAQLVERTEAGVAMGKRGAVTVAYNGLAARAGLESLKQGGGAIDAVLTAALTQVALTAGAPISYFGIMSLVYYDAGSGTVHTMNAEWNTVLGEDDPLTIPDGFRGWRSSSRRSMWPRTGSGVGEDCRVLGDSGAGPCPPAGDARDLPTWRATVPWAERAALIEVSSQKVRGMSSPGRSATTCTTLRERDHDPAR